MGSQTEELPLTYVLTCGCGKSVGTFRDQVIVGGALSQCSCTTLKVLRLHASSCSIDPESTQQSDLMKASNRPLTSTKLQGSYSGVVCQSLRLSVSQRRACQRKQKARPKPQRKVYYNRTNTGQQTPSSSLGQYYRGLDISDETTFNDLDVGGSWCSTCHNSAHDTSMHEVSTPTPGGHSRSIQQLLTSPWSKSLGCSDDTSDRPPNSLRQLVAHIRTFCNELRSYNGWAKRRDHLHDQIRKRYDWEVAPDRIVAWLEPREMFNIGKANRSTEVFIEELWVLARDLLIQHGEDQIRPSLTPAQQTTLEENDLLRIYCRQVMLFPDHILPIDKGAIRVFEINLCKAYNTYVQSMRQIETMNLFSTCTMVPDLSKGLFYMLRIPTTHMRVRIQFCTPDGWLPTLVFPKVEKLDRYLEEVEVCQDVISVFDDKDVQLYREWVCDLCEYIGFGTEKMQDLDIEDLLLISFGLGEMAVERTRGFRIVEDTGLD